MLVEEKHLCPSIVEFIKQKSPKTGIPTSMKTNYPVIMRLHVPVISVIYAQMFAFVVNYNVKDDNPPPPPFPYCPQYMGSLKAGLWTL